MKGVLAKVISQAENAFVEGRQILDAVLIANEVIDSIFKSNGVAILCKLDIEKAYYHVEWSFLLMVMEKIGFEEKCNGGPQLSNEEISLWWFLSACQVEGEVGKGLRSLTCSDPDGQGGECDDLAGELGCKVGSFLSTNLGMPLGASFNSVAAWDGIEERFHKRLAMWKRQYISKEGRITLICSSLSNLPIYFMSILHLPRVVRMRLERIQRDFLWRGRALERKPHLVRWSTVCLDKSKRGLGVKSLATLNKALLGKWMRRFANKREAFWNQVIRGKYGEDRGGWLSREVREGHGVGLWKAIRNLGHLVSSRISFVVVAAKEAWVSDLWTVSASGEMGGVEILGLPGVSMIGSWMRWRTYWGLYARKE
ncbi:putative ribonuclease H protein [Vitis vinifera]|uniref:Putative ribonuclease H protein n=1 Tax=Vitis vinifera TaxID=29760 RepID=A0A438CP93_VITVI|nr:putative ribonuclease H protein [Vitis vinifera]